MACSFGVQSFGEQMKNGGVRCQPWKSDPAGKLGRDYGCNSLVKLLSSCSVLCRRVTPLETSLNACNRIQIREIIFYNIS